MLNEVQFGSSCVVENVDRLDDLMKRRLQDFGVVVGAEVKVKSAAAFGGPLLLDVNSQLVAIRKSDAKKIGVKVI